MIEDMMICKFVAEHQTLHLQGSNSDPGILAQDYEHVALIASSPGSRCKQSYKCGDALDEQLETVSAQIAPGAFLVARDQFASWDSNIEDLTSRLWGVLFLLQPSHWKYRCRWTLNPHGRSSWSSQGCLRVRWRLSSTSAAPSYVPPARFPPLEAFGRRPPNARRRVSSGRHPKPYTKAGVSKFSLKIPKADGRLEPRTSIIGRGCSHRHRIQVDARERMATTEWPKSTPL